MRLTPPPATLAAGGGRRRPAGEGFDAAALRRVRRLAWLQRHFDADPELAALVVDLEEEIERLRARLRRLGEPSCG
ncbi:hypothetical protein Talka_02185 [Tepidimonas alkaliphilus]|uniref:MerR HTH family regulatory protein n=1 Tax=Tepidimonas alkaliphilus TaxID=2588942 RepID=A0A554W4C7_9BURK|nr:hypothetical protein Talka_02185 [Tepidimonas alkaliphilus]